MVPSQRYCTRCGAANQAQDAFCFACGSALQAKPTTTPSSLAGSATSTSTGLLTPNLLLKQRYRILEPIGKGGFGAVYKAEDVQLGNRPLAIKELSQSVLNPQEIAEATENFKREALILAALKHPNLPSIYEQFSEAGRWYLVMDFIEGQTLEAYLAQAKGGKLSIEETLQIGVQLCTVLDYLHTRKPPIIFRDLKPANIMRTTDGNLFLIDFGIARHFKVGQKKDTIAFGSPGYAAPEQYGRAQTTARSDIYSLGSTLHHLLTGIDPSVRPFHFDPLQQSGQPTPPGLQQLLMQMLDMDENKRSANMSEVKQTLQRLLSLIMAGQGNTSLPGTQSTPTALSPLQQTQTRPPSTSPHPVAGGIFQKAMSSREALDAGIAFVRLGRFEDALAAFDRAIHLDPKNTLAWNNKGVALERLGRYEEAVELYTKAEKLDPTSTFATNNRAKLEAFLKSAPSNVPQEPVVPHPLGQPQVLVGTGKDQFTPATIDQLADYIFAQRSHTAYFSLTVFIMVMLTVLALGVFPKSLFLTIPLSLVVVYFIRKRDRKKTHVVMHYSLGVEDRQFYTHLCSGLAALAKVRRLRQVTALQALGNWKQNAGASQIVSFNPVQLLAPPWLETNLAVWGIQCNNLLLLFLPDCIIAEQGKRVYAINYQDLMLTSHYSEFMEAGYPPADARILRYAWQYINKDGTPDQRYRNNYQVAVTEATYLNLSTNTGLTLSLQASNRGNAEHFLACLRSYKPSPPIQQASPVQQIPQTSPIQQVPQIHMRNYGSPLHETKGKKVFKYPRGQNPNHSNKLDIY